MSDLQVMKRVSNEIPRNLTDLKQYTVLYYLHIIFFWSWFLNMFPPLLIIICFPHFSLGDTKETRLEERYITLIIVGGIAAFILGCFCLWKRMKRGSSHSQGKQNFEFLLFFFFFNSHHQFKSIERVVYV